MRSVVTGSLTKLGPVPLSSGRLSRAGIEGSRGRRVVVGVDGAGLVAALVDGARLSGTLDARGAWVGSGREDEGGKSDKL
jgi:hypothetical protein